MTRKTPRVAILLGVLAVAAAAGGAVVATSDWGRTAAGAAAATSGGAGAGTGAAATDDGAQGGPVSTPEIVAGPTGAVATDEPAAVTGGSVTPVLGYADWDPAGRLVEASGFVSGVVESGGTCTLVLVNGGSRAEATSAAEPDATTTVCAPLTVPGDQLAPGTWQATLSYSSAGSQGTSQPLAVEVAA